MTNTRDLRSKQYSLITLVLPFLVALLNMGFILWASARYFDFTDEGYSLNLINNPHAFQGRITRFGELISWIFHYLGNSIYKIRLVSACSVFIVSMVAINLALPNRFSVCHPRTSLSLKFLNQRLLLLVIIASTSILAIWPSVTPTYNTVNFLSMSLFVTALLGISNRLSSDKPIKYSDLFLYTLFLGISLVFVAYCRLTSYLFISLAIVFVSIISHQLFRRILVSSLIISFAIYLVSSIMNFGGLNAFVADIHHAFEITKSWDSLGGDFSFVSSLIRLAPRKLNLGSFALSLLLLVVAVNLSESLYRKIVKVSAVSCLIFGVLTLAVLPHIDFLSSFAFFCKPTKPLVLAIISPVLLIISSVAIFQKYTSRFHQKHNLIGFGGRIFQLPFPNPWQPTRYSLNVSSFDVSNILIICLPLAFAFSSSNGVISHASLASFFIVLVYFRLALKPRVQSSGIDFANEIYSSRMSGLITSVIPFLVSFYLAYNYVLCPFPSLEPLVTQNRVLELPGNSKLTVSQSQYELVHTIRTAASKSGFQYGDPILDLTGQSPGLIYALGGKPVGWPWILGLLPGSDKAAVKILEKTDQDELKNSYVLFSDHPSPLKATEVLAHFNLDLEDPQSYKLITSLFSKFTRTNIYLYQPLGDS